MPIAPVLQRFVDEELALAPALVERILTGSLQSLRGDLRRPDAKPVDGVPSSVVADALQRHGAAYRQAFLEALRSGVQTHLAEHQVGAAAQASPSPGGLELMDESRVEVDIEISRAMQLIDTQAEWELRELQTFTSTLVGQVHVSTESNPFRPLVYATALWEGACAASPVSAHRKAMLRTSAGVAADLLRKAWAGACSRLESQGVEPGIYRTVLLAPGTVPTRHPGATPRAESGGLARLLASMPVDGSATLEVGVRRAAIEMGAPPPNFSTADAMSPEFEQALARLDEVLRHLPLSSMTARAQGQTLIKRLDLHRAVLSASTSTPRQRQLIALVARLFDSMLVDPQVPAGFAALIARLQGSVLRLALHEPDVIDAMAHPVWQLLGRIAAGGAGYPLAGDPRGAALLAFCEALVESLARNRAPNAGLYRRAVEQLDAFLADQLDTELRTARASVQMLQLAERREILEQQLGQRLHDQVAPLRLDASMRRFVTGVWSKVLAESMLRDGEQADTTRGYIKLVDHLLWSLRLPDHPQSRQRLLSLLPGMLQRLRDGMALIQWPTAEQDHIMAELMAVHTEALRPGARDDAALTPQQIVQQMRDEVLPPATGHGSFSDSVIDLGSLETVPAELMDLRPAEPVSRVEALQPGDRLRLFLHRRWTRVQVIWRSDQGLFLLFAGETAGLTHSITSRALDKLNAAGLVQPLESRSVVQRALDNVERSSVRPA